MPNMDEKQTKQNQTMVHKTAPSVSSSVPKQTSQRPVTPMSAVPKVESTISARQAPIVPKSTLSETSKKEQIETKKKQKIEQRLKSSNISMDDLETINEQNLKQYRSRVTRNRALIITLVILLIAAITTFAILLSINKMVNNCQIYVHGNVDADVIVDGEKMDEFRTPIGVQGNRVYVIDTDIDINSTGEFDIYFTIDVYQAGVKLKNSFAYEYNHELFHDDGNGRYVSNHSIAGGQTIDLFNGVVLDDAYENTLTTENFSMKVNIYFTRA